MEAGSTNGMMLQHSISGVFEMTAGEHLSYWARSEKFSFLGSAVQKNPPKEAKRAVGKAAT